MSYANVLKMINLHRIQNMQRHFTSTSQTKLITKSFEIWIFLRRFLVESFCIYWWLRGKEQSLVVEFWDNRYAVEWIEVLNKNSWTLFEKTWNFHENFHNLLWKCKFFCERVLIANFMKEWNLFDKTFAK